MRSTTLTFLLPLATIVGISARSDTKWRLSFPQGLLGTTTINTNGDCLVVTKNGIVHAVTNGVIRWSFTPGSLVAGTPTVGLDLVGRGNI